jgi:hypothetical protein
VITGRHGTPLAVSLTSENRHDVTQLTALLDATPRSWTRHPASAASWAAPSPTTAADRRPRQVPPPPPSPRHHTEDLPQGHPHGSGPGKSRWIVERTFTWPHQRNTYEPPTKNEPTSTSNANADSVCRLRASAITLGRWGWHGPVHEPREPPFVRARG